MMGKKSILIVENDTGIRELLVLYLQDKGFVVMAAKSGKDALAIICQELVHLILLDIEMPGLNSSGLCQKLRKKLDVPIIFMCSPRTVIQQKSFIECKANDYISKPFQFELMELKIKSLLMDKYRN